MTFVHGPEGVTFSADKPAKLRFFLGCVDDLAPAEDGSGQVTLLPVKSRVAIFEIRCWWNVWFPSISSSTRCMSFGASSQVKTSPS